MRFWSFLRSETFLTVEERVAAGVAFLDEKVPGWADKISINHFDIATIDRNTHIYPVNKIPATIFPNRKIAMLLHLYNKCRPD